MKPIQAFLMATIGLVVIFILSSIFIINQGQHAILLRLGRLVSENPNTVRIIGPGMHIKFPFVDTVRIFDTRIQTVDIKSSRIVTKEKKDVIVDYYVKWRIENLAQYYKATGGSQFKAETLLEQQLNTSLRAQFGRRTISDVVSGGRDDVMEVLRDRAEAQAGELGIHVVDVRIKGIELPENTSNAIYQRMRADMQKIANRHRADGYAAAEAIQANADAQVTVLLAKAQSSGKAIRAEGQAAAADIYNQAYSQNAKFFSLYRHLLAYESNFKHNDHWLVLDSKGAFFNYFKRGPNSLNENKHA